MDERGNRLELTQMPQEQAMLIGIENGLSGWLVSESLDELAQLALTAGAEVVGRVSQKREKPDPLYYMGKGKVEELKELRAEVPFDLLICDDELSATQQRTLEEILPVKVVDRSALILDIFAQHARSHEGRLQVELAQLEYLLPRLTGRGVALSRLGGGIGTRGPGETKLEYDRRRIKRRIKELKDDITQVRRHRAINRRQRQKEGLPVIAIVGYTNAGKSTLFNALAGADALVEDKLFATLDPTARSVVLPDGRKVLFSDTVGFIQKLPVTLVAAFRATLEEVREADFILQVVDVSHPQYQKQAETVRRVLAELEVDKPTLTALNKIDLLANRSRLKEARPLFPRAVDISAKTGEGLDRLLSKVAALVSRGTMRFNFIIPYQSSEILNFLRQRGTILIEEYTPDGVLVTARLPGYLWAAMKSSLHKYKRSNRKIAGGGQ